MTDSEIVDIFNTIPLDDNLYLIAKLANSSGIFATNGKLAYMAENLDEKRTESIETEYLSLQTNIHIHAVENDSSFNDGFYNIIIFKSDFKDCNFSSFVHLCEIYSDNICELKFKDFFYSLISLFQLPTEQAFKNALGLYGELKFMQYMWQQHKIDISNDWHKSGSYSTFDFSGNYNYEVKSVLSSELSVTIKHSQVFNKQKCILVVVNCENYNSGETIMDVIEWLKTQKHAFNGLNYNINLQKELKRISHPQATTLKFFATKITLYDTNSINPFDNLPDKISALSYKYDLSDESFVEEYIYI